MDEQRSGLPRGKMVENVATTSSRSELCYGIALASNRQTSSFAKSSIGPDGSRKYLTYLHLHSLFNIYQWLLQNTDRLTDKLKEDKIGATSYGVEYDDSIKQHSSFESIVDSIDTAYLSKEVREEKTSGNGRENLVDTRKDIRRNEKEETKREKPFRCADCGKEFSQLRNYKYHRSVHEGTREFAASCPECGKYFNDRGYLSSHMKIHRNRKEYACLVCGKSFNQRVAYNMHAKIHTGLKPHSCEQCGKAFSRKMLLKQHLRTHSGERPYRCHICQKAFADRSNMTLHTKLHSGLKPYQCSLCSKAFTKKHHLKTHLNSHTGFKPYSCSKCGLNFSQSSNMRTHFKKCTYETNPIVLIDDSRKT